MTNLRVSRGSPLPPPHDSGDGQRGEQRIERVSSTGRLTGIRKLNRKRRRQWRRQRRRWRRGGAGLETELPGRSFDRSGRIDRGGDRCDKQYEAGDEADDFHNASMSRGRPTFKTVGILPAVEIPQPTRPIIVCGMARSGTSLVGQLIKASGNAVIFPEMSPHSTTAIFDLLPQVRATIRAQRWRPFSDADIEARVVELLRRIWGAGRDPELHDDVGQPRFGLKQPHAEELRARFVTTLAAFPPQWVYTVRDPVAIYDSTLRMSAGGDLSPGQFAERFENSLSQIEELVATGDGFTFQADRAAGNPEYRLMRSRRLYEFLGLPFGAAAERFVDKWPQINTSSGSNVGQLTPEEVAARVEKFATSDASTDLTDRIAGLD